jgi:hypothetical protein
MFVVFLLLHFCLLCYNIFVFVVISKNLYQSEVLYLSLLLFLKNCIRVRFYVNTSRNGGDKQMEN